MKGIVLAGGTGSRLLPSTGAISKQLLPVYDKPMVYYPMSVLMEAGIRDILVISTPRDLPAFERLFEDGSGFGLRLSYAEQPSPDGLAQAFLIGRDFIGGNPCAMALGDNIFLGSGLRPRLLAAAARAESGIATVFGYRTPDPRCFGVIGFGPDGHPDRIDEKPANPRSPWCVTGLYFYDGMAPEYAAELRPSARGELEITDLNMKYLEAGKLEADLLDGGFLWMDAGTHESLMDAAAAVRDAERSAGRKIACLEEIAYRNGWIGADRLMEAARRLYGSPYGEYLRRVPDGTGTGKGILSWKDGWSPAEPAS